MNGNASHKTEFYMGSRAPDILGTRRNGSFFSLDQQAGRQAVIIFLGSIGLEASLPYLAQFREMAPEFDCHKCDILFLVDGMSFDAAKFKLDSHSDINVIFCLPQTFETWGGYNHLPEAYVLDRSSRIISSVGGTTPELLAKRALTHLQDSDRRNSIATIPAPVLIVPNVFGPAICEDLIRYFEANAHTPGGIATIDADGAAYNRLDVSKKKRRDMVLDPRGRHFSIVSEILSAACLPEIRRAFQFDVAFVDRILLARYDSDGGCFLRHRDNSAPAVAHRQFAVSVNLNAENYEGGHLTFPEYNDLPYKAPTGAAAIFSASLLHEAALVLNGSRYVLLTFFSNAEAASGKLAQAG